MERIGRAPHHLVAAPVVALGRRHARVPGHALHGADVVAGGQKIAHERPAHIMGRQGRDAGLPRALVEHLVDRVGAHARAVLSDAPGLVDGHEQRARLPAAQFQPPVEGSGSTRRDRDRALLVVLAVQDAQRGRGGYVVVERERGQLGAAQATGVERRQHRRVAHAGRACVPGARLHQCGQFTPGDGPTARQALTLVGLDLADAAVLLVAHRVGVAGLPRDAPEDGERQVDRRRRGPLVSGVVGLHEALPDARDLGGAQVVPGEGRGVGDREEAGHGAQALPDGLLARRRQALDVGVHWVDEQFRSCRRLPWCVEQFKAAHLSLAYGQGVHPHQLALTMSLCRSFAIRQQAMPSRHKNVQLLQCEDDVGL